MASKCVLSRENNPSDRLTILKFGSARSLLLLADFPINDVSNKKKPFIFIFTKSAPANKSLLKWLFSIPNNCCHYRMVDQRIHISIGAVNV